jgi:DNA-binding transcriptional LysR family regulator
VTPSTLRIRHLQVFLAVAQTGSMQRAARSVHLTQPAISKMIGELESIFGAELFERSKRGVALTECGRALVDRAELLFNDLEMAKLELAAIGRGAVGHVRVGVLPVAEAILPAALLTLRKVASGLTVQIQEGTRTALLNSLRRGEIECVVGRLDASPNGNDFRSEKLVQIPVKIVVHPSHPLTRLRRVTWLDLSRYAWILPQAGAPIRSVIDNQFAAFGIVPPSPVIESTSTRVNFEVVRGTDTIGVMTEDAALGYQRSRKLTILNVKFGAPLPYVGVVTRTERVSNALSTFLKVLRNECSVLNR